MSTINNFTEEQIKRIDELNSKFADRINKTKGQIPNEDSFEKSGLFDKLRESPEYLEEYKKRAEKKIGPKLN